MASIGSKVWSFQSVMQGVSCLMLTLKVMIDGENLSNSALGFWNIICTGVLDRIM